MQHSAHEAVANGGSQVVQGIRLGKNSLATVQDLEIALDAAVHINKHLNRELHSLSEQLRCAEADKHAWEAHARRLAMQLAKYKLASGGRVACVLCVEGVVVEVVCLRQFEGRLHAHKQMPIIHTETHLVPALAPASPSCPLQTSRRRSKNNSSLRPSCRNYQAVTATTRTANTSRTFSSSSRYHSSQMTPQQ